MPFLQCCNPSIYWVACIVSFGYFHVLALPQHEAAPIEVCSLWSLLKTIGKVCATAWFCLLQPGASHLAMGVSKQPQVGHKDLASPTAPGADHPLVAPLLTEFLDVFSQPEFPLES